ncbi:TolC family protein [Aquariibacter albus]|uniref:Protein CyaE n=1 Tax=Aquariibacter albus TaxID=2759899 RepID=A0A839HK51_9BURK|nr:TolC family protein [Aquariibacter albus]MBB1162835.1 TolC family protein [Aquariibacter albus]
MSRLTLRRMSAPGLLAGLLLGGASLQAQPPSAEGPEALHRAAQALPAALPRDQAGCPTGPVSQPLGLHEAVARSLCQSPKARGAWALARQRAAELGVVEASYWPTVQAGAIYDETRQRYREPAVSTSNKTEGMSLRLNWVLFDGGRRSGRQQQARALLASANASQDAVVRSELLEALRAYHLAQAAEALRLATTEVEQIARRTAERVKGRQAGGVSAKAELMQAQAALSRATLGRLDAEAGAQAARGELARRMGLPAPTALTVPALQLLPSAQALPADAQALIDEALQQHPRVIAARAEAEAARGRQAAAQAEDWPVLSVSAQQTTQQPPNGSLFVVDRVRSASVQLSVPIFEGGAGPARRRAGAAEVQRAEASADELRDEVERSLWRSWQEARAQNQRIEAVDRLVRDTREAADGLAARFNAGAGGLFEWLSAQQDAARARREQVEAVLAWHDARLRLASQVGSLGAWLLAQP